VNGCETMLYRKGSYNGLKAFIFNDLLEFIGVCEGM